MKKLLVTGGAGAIGSNLIEHWATKFELIVVLDNFATSKPEALPPLENLKVLVGDVSEIKDVRLAFAEATPDVVIHSAASYKDPSDWESDIAGNILGAVNIARLINEYKPQLVVNFQTALVYGKPSKLPIPVDHPTNPVSSYAISKLAGESFLLNCGHPVLSLRLANVTGPRLSIGPIPTFYKNIPASIECNVSTAKRDFLDMDDFLDLMDKILHGTIRSGVFNVSTGKSNSILDIFNEAKFHHGKANTNPGQIFEPGVDDIKDVVLDARLTNETFGWTPKYQFKEIMRRAFEWYDANGITDIYTHIKPRG